MLDQPMKECPDCKAELRADAKVCRYCQHRFGDRGRKAAVGGVIALAAAAVFAIGVAPRSSPQAGAPAQPPAVPTAAWSPSKSADPKIQALLVKQANLEDACRGGYVTIDSPVCKQRDDVDDQLSKAGWCYGEPGQFGAQETWHDCVAREVAPMDERHSKWARDCQDVIRADLNDPKSADFPDPTVDAGAFVHMQMPDTEKGPDPSKMSPAAMNAWTDKHAELFSETISFKFHAKNLMGGVQRYTAFCTFMDNFDGTTKMTRHAAGAD